MVPIPDVPLADLFIQVYVWIDDALMDNSLVIPPRPGPMPACSDAELLPGRSPAGLAALLPPSPSAERGQSTSALALGSL